MSPVILVFGAVATIDRIEGDIAVLEWRDLCVTELPVSVLPDGIEEGDTLVIRSRRVSKSSARGLERRPHRAAVDPARGAGESGYGREE